MSDQKVTNLRVSTHSACDKVAGAIARCLQNNEKVELTSIGAGALNQAVKAVSIARSFVASQGIDLCVVPAFKNIEIDGNQRTAIKLMVRTYS